jgi:hypothetical protein
MVMRNAGKLLAIMQKLDQLDGKKIAVGLLPQSGSDNIDHGFYNEFGTTYIPARPFIDAPVSDDLENTKELTRTGIEAIHNGSGIDGLLDPIKTAATKAIQKKIEEKSSPSNAPSTIAHKGFDDPLIETGSMMASVAGEFRYCYRSIYSRPTFKYYDLMAVAVLIRQPANGLLRN